MEVQVSGFVQGANASTNVRQLTAISVCSGCAGFVRAQTFHVNILESNIAGLEDDGVPERRVGDRDAIDSDVFAISNSQRYRSGEHSRTTPSYSRTALRLSVRSNQVVSFTANMH